MYPTQWLGGDYKSMKVYAAASPVMPADKHARKMTTFRKINAFVTPLPSLRKNYSAADNSRTHRVSVCRDHVTNRKRINQYEVVDEINHGVHGKIKLAYNTLTNGRVALKVMRRAARTTCALDAIRRELAVLKRVRHDNIIACLEVIDDPGHPKVYVVLEHAGFGRLPWRSRGRDRACRYEWDRIQDGMKLRETTEAAVLCEGLPLPVAGFDRLSLANQPSDSSSCLAPCKSPNPPASSGEANEQGLSPPYGSLHSVNADIYKRVPLPDQFQYVPCITIAQARHTILDIVSGLECLHAHGIVHRDIKPDNLLLTRDYRVKICDFSTSFVGHPSSHATPFGDPSPAVNGVLALFDGEREMRRTIGTPAFMAPELCCMKLDAMDLETLQQVDVWSLGVTLYCLIFARLPFVADNEYQLYRTVAVQDVYIPKQRLRPVCPSLEFSAPMPLSTRQYRRDDVIENEYLGEELLDLLHRMLTRNPQKRIRLADIKNHPWLSQASADHDNLRTPKGKLDSECSIEPLFLPPTCAS